MNSSPVRLKALLQQRHWQSHATFCAEYDKAASVIDRSLAGSYPSRAQLHRWLSGTVHGLPFPHHCRVLEAMFPDWTIEQLFRPVDSDPADSPAPRTQASLARKDIGQLLGMVETGFREPDSSPPAWGPAGAADQRAGGSPQALASAISDYASGENGTITRQVGKKLVELSRQLRLSDAETRQLAALAGNVVELEVGLSIDIDRQGRAAVVYEHDLINLSERPLGRIPREVWFQYTDAKITITPTKHNDRAIVIQRIHDAGSLAKFAFKISPPLGPGERTVVRYLCEGGSFRDALYWRQAMPRYTRRYTLNVRHQGAGRLTGCTATVEHPDGSEASVTEGLLWDYDDHGVSLTLAADYLRPGQAVELRWDTDRAASRPA